MNGHHTHYHKATKTWFSVEACDKCGGDMMAANAVKLLNPWVLPYKLKLVDELPPEGGYDDETDEVVCDNCYGAH